MSQDYHHEIGHETLRKEFERYQKLSPKGVSLVHRGNKVKLQFKFGSKPRSKYDCNCDFTLDGITEAYRKSIKVAQAFKIFTSEVEFWEWYNLEIKEENKVENDLLTFGEAIKKIEDDFWNRSDRRKQKRNKDNPSDVNSWNDAYFRFYKYLPQEKIVNIKDIQDVLKRWKQGTKSYKSAVSVFKKLAKIGNQKKIVERLDSLNVGQTEFKELQSATLEDFLRWRDEVLGITKELHPNCDLETRKAWLWAFSMQVVYGLRIHEVFAIQNLTETYKTKDNIYLPALNNPKNTQNVIVIGSHTKMGTKTKTNYRLSKPLLPNNYPDLIERLEIKTPLLPNNEPKSEDSKNRVNFYNNKASKYLKSWNAPFTQTHAFRHLANLNGMQSGVPLEVRAQSLGHTPAMNDSIYKKRQHTKTTLDILLKSNNLAIELTSTIVEAKQILKRYPHSMPAISELLAKIYSKSESEIETLLD